MGTLNGEFFKHSKGERLPKKKYFYMELQNTEKAFSSFHANEEKVERKACTPDSEAKLILVTQYLCLFKKN